MPDQRRNQLNRTATIKSSSLIGRLLTYSQEARTKKLKQNRLKIQLLKLTP